MAYTKILIPDHVGPGVRWVVREALDTRLRDVHALLRMPIPEVEITATGHFTIVDTLLECIEGVSAVLFPRTGNSSDAFLECMKRHYSVEGNEPEGALPTDTVATELLFTFRHSLQHCLGLALKSPDKQGIREAVVMPRELLVFRETFSLSEGQVESLEKGAWPAGLNRPTLQMQGSNMMLLAVEALYVGTRRLVASVLADASAMGYAEQSLQEYRGKQLSRYAAMHEIFHNALDAQLSQRD